MSLVGTSSRQLPVGEEGKPAVRPGSMKIAAVIAALGMALQDALDWGRAAGS